MWNSEIGTISDDVRPAKMHIVKATINHPTILRITVHYLSDELFRHG
jgi:hypothetical protein